MRYMGLVKMREDVGEPPPELVEAMGKEMGEAFAAGWMLDAGGLSPTAPSVQIRLRGGDLTVTDGPYAEAKEVVGGDSIYEAASDDEAAALGRCVVELHQQHWPGWEGSVEVRRIAGPDEAAPAGA